jgi:hypothetical protein
MIIAVDFDGTLVSHEYPEIGKPYDDVFKLCITLKSMGHELILFTCREDYICGRPLLSDAVSFCNKKGLFFDAVNENLERHKNMGILCRKPVWDILIDDTAGFEPSKWADILDTVLNKKTYINSIDI